MTRYPDTSFLFNLYVPQAHARAAAAYFARITLPLAVTSLNHLELINAVNLALFRKIIASGRGDAALAAIDDDIGSGVLEIVPCDWSAVHSRALALATRHTSSGGHRGFDILHVATALELGAREFLTFDARQATLAKLAGLKTPLRT